MISHETLPGRDEEGVRVLAPLRGDIAVAQFVVPEHLRSDPSIILVGEDQTGCWTVEENHGRIRGRFRHREDALRFARSERDMLSEDAIVVASPARVHPGGDAPKTAS